QLVFERFLVFLDRLHLADGLLQLRDIGLGGGDLLVQRPQLGLEAVVEKEVPDPRQHEEEHEQHQLLPAELALLGCADGEEVDADHRARSSYRSLDLRRASPMATAADGATSTT